MSFLLPLSRLGKEEKDAHTCLKDNKVPDLAWGSLSPGEEGGNVPGAGRAGDAEAASGRLIPTSGQLAGQPSPASLLPSTNISQGPAPF